ncbi:hypothetical protein GCM10018785_47270 [Streptomyces longispororuber]|uniref:Uncharacterized protein n=1 Tax=Streptomyces longispororuber TaxID=68230 RepID=A0A918ZXT5_9ACTN|nr:hypothetical protein GCM10018785_47270 [Streptomyces longispororuber]
MLLPLPLPLLLPSYVASGSTVPYAVCGPGGPGGPGAASVAYGTAVPPCPPERTPEPGPGQAPPPAQGAR